jgi:hypothetical protein
MFLKNVVETDIQIQALVNLISLSIENGIGIRSLGLSILMHNEISYAIFRILFQNLN